MSLGVHPQYLTTSSKENKLGSSNHGSGAKIVFRFSGTQRPGQEVCTVFVHQSNCPMAEGEPRATANRRPRDANVVMGLHARLS